ncbi:helix-turn-helix transcriptional regulator [Hyphomicrobium sp.]|uniref:helix-turn-helix domain-containing protein n=1 Tax=Hyphomicrobium sp. TaxID=82 RepID=UPI0025BD0772|nr:helix-turn-helix transcriptional regulator [Hyphomicrobium sp.]MCC7253972.1 helix-turn-helix transcriptional regulator [Hyphomicrobium sp.]
MDFDLFRLAAPWPVEQEMLPTLSASVDALRPQTRRVLSLLVEGHSNKEIAWRLSLQESTVKSHITTITKALGCRNRTQAALIAFCVVCNLPSQAAKLRAIIDSRALRTPSNPKG